MKLFKWFRDILSWVFTPCKTEMNIREKKEKIENLYHKW